MSAARWTGVLLAAGAAIALFFTTHTPDAAPSPAAGSPAPAALPPDLHPATPAHVAASAASPAASMPAPPPPVGAEGYGPHIERAQAGDDIAAAWQAVQWLQQCAANERQRSSFEQLRNLGQLPQAAAGVLLAQLDAEGRRCQTVTDQHRALLPELAARAMRAGVPLAAAAYADAIAPASLTDAQRQEVAEALRRDARTNGALSLLAAVQADDAWGLSDAERLTFHAALQQLADEPDEPGSINLARSLAQHSAMRFKTPPTPEQLAAAKLASQQIVAHLHALEQP